MSILLAWLNGGIFEVIKAYIDRFHALPDLTLICSGVVLRVLFQSRELNLISAAEDGEIRVWDLVAQSCLATLKVLFADTTGFV